MKLKSIIIDDEPLARECIGGYSAAVDYIDVVGTGANPTEILHLLKPGSVDLMFLDIQMPFINGLDFLKTLKDPPMVILTTAYREFAIEGFQLDVLDYLVKPITFDRYLKAVNKARDYHLLQHRLQTVDNYFFIKCTNKFERIYFEDILYVQGLQNYVTIFTTKGRYITHLTLKAVEENLNEKAFIRVHKSYLVATSRIESLENNDVIVQSVRIPVSRNYRDELMRVVNSRLWKK